MENPCHHTQIFLHIENTAPQRIKIVDKIGIRTPFISI